MALTFFERLFSNYLDTNKTTPQRLYDCGMYTLALLIDRNTDGAYDQVITDLTAALTALNNDISGVDTGLTIQFGKTQTNDEVQESFKFTMSDKEGVIADKLGGRGTEAYILFYPHGITEYTSATKTNMPKLTKRVNEAATTHATALGTVLKTLLQGFQASWISSRGVQTTQFGRVGNSRTGRNKNETAVQVELMGTIDFLKYTFRNDLPTADSYFKFSLLFNPTHHKHIINSGTIAKGDKLVKFDEIFHDEQEISIRNTTNNAKIFVYKAINIGDEPEEGTGIEFNTNTTKKIKVSAIGNLDFPLMIFKNLSEVNEATFIVELLEMQEP